MGTTYTVKVVTQRLDPEDQKEIQSLIGSELRTVDEKMSTYREESEVSRFNRWRTTAPFRVSPETFTVFQEAQEVSELTGGAFDVTVGPLVNAWGFGPAPRRPEAPSEREIAELVEHVGYKKLHLDPVAMTLLKKDPLLGCDLSAIAEGYAIDRVADALEARQIFDYMVEVGGEVRSGGRNQDGHPWRIAIERPSTGDGGFLHIVALSGGALATSGDYRNYYERNGVRVAHEIDPRTGHPAAHRLASVSVVADRCMRADALATAFMVLGAEEGYLLASEKNWAVLFLTRKQGGGFEERRTPAFERFLGGDAETLYNGVRHGALPAGEFDHRRRHAGDGGRGDLQ